MIGTLTGILDESAENHILLDVRACCRKSREPKQTRQ